MKSLSNLFLIYILILIPNNLFGKTLEDSTKIEKREYTSTRISTTPPHIDGLLDEESWNQVEWSGNFVQREPYENEAPSQQTQFKLLYDDDNIYVGIRCFDSAPDSIEKRMSRRDGFDGDWVEINIDSYHDLRTAFSFTVSASGVKGDEAITNDDNWDDSWDPIWYVKTSIDNQGWIAEMRIPLSQLRFGKQEEYIWGLQISRRLFRKEEISCWQFVPQNSSGWVHEFGKLYGIKNITPKKQKDLTPYVVGRIENYKEEEENPFADGQDLTGTIGLDGKIGLTNDLTLDFTINPDFGQVEADPSEVNLTTFETKFDEKRPFFIEGKNIFDFSLTGGDGPLSSDNLFYSRRIGKTPSLTPDTEDDEYVKTPNNTTILGAFKISGKTKKGWSVGVLESVTEEEKALIDNNGVRRKEIIEPSTNYFIGRLQKEMNNSNTRIGGMITATNRNLTTTTLKDNFHRAAYTGGIDFNHQWKEQTYYLNASLAFSEIQGSENVIYETQTSAPHFFQRPDADHIEADSTLTSLSGFAGNLQIGRAGNSKWMYTFWVTWRSPGFNTNDVGYVRRNDEIQQVAWVGFYQGEPFSIFRSFRLNINQWSGFTFGSETRYYGGNFSANWMFNNFYRMGGGYSREGKSISTSTLRGGPSLLYDGNNSIWTFLSSDQRKKLHFFAQYSNSFYDKKTAQSQNFYFGASLQLSDAFNLSLYPGIYLENDKIAYVETLDDLEEIRYIRGSIEQTQTYMTIRFNYNITPDFTIQYYGMPFLSARKYDDFKYINDSKAQDFNQRYIAYNNSQISYNVSENIYEVDEDLNSVIDYSFDNPNTNYFDFNSNLVVRWEYMPGSALYLVWTQSRNNYNSLGEFNLWDDTQSLFKSFPQNVFLIKLSYRFGL